MSIIVDSTVPLDDILTALTGSGKYETYQVSVFIRKKDFIFRSL